MKPAILLDVDGPLNPFTAKSLPEGYTAHIMRPDSWTDPRPLKVLLNPLHGPSLASTGAEVIWATTWEHEANEWIGPHIGLPELPVIDWIDRDYWNTEGLYWKTKRIVQWMNEFRPETPYIWIDDECTRKDREYIKYYSDELGTTLQISPKFGLRDQDFDYLRDWTAKNGLHTQ